MLWRRGKSYSQDLRDRVFAAADDGELVGQIAARLRVSISYVSKVLSRRRLGQFVPTPADVALRIGFANQQMRWSPRGAHLMPKARTAVINGTFNKDYGARGRRAHRPFRDAA